MEVLLHLRRVPRGLAQAVLSESGHPSTSNEDIPQRWKEDFEGLLNPGRQETRPEDSGVSLSISLAEVTRVVRKLHSGKAPGVDEVAEHC